MTFSVLVAEPGNEEWASIAKGIRRQRPDASILRVKDGEQAVRFLFQRGLFSERAETADLVLLAMDLTLVPWKEIVARLRNDPRTRSTPVVVISRDKQNADVDAALDSQPWLSQQQSILIIRTVGLEREVAKAVNQLCCDLSRHDERSSKECSELSG